MIFVRVKYRVTDCTREEYLQKLFDEGLPQACRAEAGNLGYDYYLNYEDPNEILLLECWKNADALAKHGKEPHFERLGRIRVENNVKSTVESVEAKLRK